MVKFGKFCRKQIIYAYPGFTTQLGGDLPVGNGIESSISTIEKIYTLNYFASSKKNGNKQPKPD